METQKEVCKDNIAQEQQTQFVCTSIQILSPILFNLGIAWKFCLWWDPCLFFLGSLRPCSKTLIFNLSIPKTCGSWFTPVSYSGSPWLSLKVKGCKVQEVQETLWSNSCILSLTMILICLFFSNPCPGNISVKLISPL